MSRARNRRERRAISVILLGGAVFAAVFVAIGYAWHGRQQDARVAELEEQLDASNAQTQQIRQLAARLERAESNYRQLQQMMGGEVNQSDRDVLLPTLPARSITSMPRASR